MSNTILEAMAMGKPVVATGVGGNTELVLEGENGFLVPPEDPEALAGRIELLLSDPSRRRTMGETGRAYVVAHHSIEAMVRSYANTYESCFDRSQRRA
jgi:glycosyltransferase involved in cell wall biosynthesis